MLHHLIIPNHVYTYRLFSRYCLVAGSGLLGYAMGFALKKILDTASLLTNLVPCSVAYPQSGSGSAGTFISNAFAISATLEPILPIPKSPSFFPRKSRPTLVCHPPARRDAFSIQILRQTKNHCPGKFNSWGRFIPCINDFYSMFCCGLKVNSCIAQASGCNKFQIRKTLDQVSVHACSLSHETNDLKR